MALFNVTINTYINLPPDIIGDLNLVLTHAQVYTFSLADFTTNLIPAYNDPEEDALEAIKVLTLPTVGILKLNNINVTINQDISSSDLSGGLLTYEADSLVLTSYVDNTFTFDVSDVGSSTFAGLTGTVTFNVGVKGNLPPSEVGNGAATIDYGETLVFTSEMFTSDTIPVYADPENDFANLLKITQLPTLGIIYLNGIPVEVNQIISFTDINLGFLTYVPDNADTNGDIQNFTFEIADNGSGIFVA